MLLDDSTWNSAETLAQLLYVQGLDCDFISAVAVLEEQTGLNGALVLALDQLILCCPRKQKCQKLCVIQDVHSGQTEINERFQEAPGKT